MPSVGRAVMLGAIRSALAFTYGGRLRILDDKPDLEWRLVFGSGLCVLSDQLASCLDSGRGAIVLDGESGQTARPQEPLEVDPSMTSATDRVAKALAERRAASAGAPTKTTKPKAQPKAEEPADDEVDEAEAPKMSVKERAAAARAARSAPKTNHSPEAEDEDEAAASRGDSDEDEDEEEADLDSAEPEPIPTPRAKAAKPKGWSGTGKKPASPAQIAAREAFAERSRAKAAAARGEPVQTEAQVKAKQSADRKAKAAAAAEAARPASQRTGKPVTVQKPLTGAALKAYQAKQAREEAASQREVKRAIAARSKKPAPAKPARAVIRDSAKSATAKAKAAPGSDTKAKVLALWAKGKNRKEIAEALGLSYAAVFHHTKGEAAEGGNIATRGRIFVDDPLYKGRGTAPQISRAEAMRRCYQDLDMSVGDISRKYNTLYQIAYTAIRPLLLAEAEE